jgi:cell division protein FtsW
MRKLPSISHSQRDRKPQKKSFTPPQKSGVILVFIVMGLVLFGLTMLYSTTSGNIGASLLVKQVFWVFIGIAGATLVNFIGYKNILPYSPHLIGLSCILLIMARFSRPINGAYRWISIPGGMGNVQPSELAKLAIILFLAYYLPKHQRQINSSIKNLIYPLFVCGIVLLLILIGKDLGTTILLAAVIWIILFVTGVKLRFLFPPLLLIPAIPLILKLYSKVRWVRITSFLNPERYQQSTGYQLWLSILAIGSGSWTGLGFAKSRMKAEYLPEAHTDFILSIVGEELGFIALLMLILAYIVFLILSVYISTRAKDKEGIVLGFGLSAMIALQAITNIGVVSGAFPTKGVPAPFISYGGSNIIICLVSVGFLLSISNYKGIKKKYGGISAKLTRSS